MTNEIATVMKSVIDMCKESKKVEIPNVGDTIQHEFNIVIIENLPLDKLNTMIN